MARKSSERQGRLRIRPFTVIAALFVISVFFLSNADAAEIEFWYGNTGRAEQSILSVCSEFNELQTKHSVKCVGHGSYEATLQKTVSAYRARKHPTLVQVLDVGTAAMVASDAFLPVSSLKIDQRGIIQDETFVGSTLDYYRSQDGLAMSLPFSTSTLVLYINDEKLAAAGIGHAPDTWEAFEAALVALSNAGEKCPWTFRLHPWYHLEQFAAMHGQPIATHGNGLDGLQAEYSFANGLHLRHLQNIKNWHDRGLAIRQENLAIANGPRAFGLGECAMLLESTGVFSAIEAASGRRFSMSVHAVPVYEEVDRQNSVVGGASLWVLKGFSDQHYEAVSAFLEFLLWPATQATLTRNTGFLPLTVEGYRAVNNDPQSREELSQLLTVARASLDHVNTDRPRGVRLGYYAQFRRIWIEEMQKAFANQIEIFEGLENAEQRGNRLLRRFERMHSGKAE